VQQAFLGVPRGLFAAFCPPSEGLPTLLASYVPADAAWWKVGHFDTRALYEAAMEIATSLRGGTRAETEAEAKQELGIDLDTDLLAHMTDEVLLFGTSLQDIERANDATWTLAFRLRDADAFGKALTTMLGNSKPMLTREATTTIAGVEVHRYGNLLRYDLLLGTGHGLFVLAGGRDAEAQLTTLLTAAKAGASDAAAKPLPELAFTDLKRHLPAGHNGSARGEIDGFVTMPSELWLTLLGGVDVFGVDAGAVEPLDDDARGALRDLLREHRLGSVRTATGHAASTWRWRLYW
jgi:hypothetical protein